MAAQSKAPKQIKQHRMFWRRRKTEQRHRPARVQPPPPRPRGDEKDLARARALLVAARAVLNDEIERLSQYQGQEDYRLVEEWGTARQPGMLEDYTGLPRLYEEVYKELSDYDYPELGEKIRRRTPGYYFRYTKPRALSGQGAWVKMTVNSDGQVELQGARANSGPGETRPPTAEHFRALLVR